MCFTKPGGCLLKESTFLTGAGERIKPDIVIKKEENVFVVDHAGRYENGDSLKDTAQEKEDKYKLLKEQVLEQLGCLSCLSW